MTRLTTCRGCGGQRADDGSLHLCAGDSGEPVTVTFSKAQVRTIIHALMLVRANCAAPAGMKVRDGYGLDGSSGCEGCGKTHVIEDVLIDACLANLAADMDLALTVRGGAAL